ncbi:MAG: hypothetical protein AB4058_16680 [Microcystaceae cyanobacterium]
MESSSPSSQASEPPNYRWAKILGTTVAVLTVTLPISAIALYSSSSTVDSSPRPPYSSVSNPNNQ